MGQTNTNTEPDEEFTIGGRPTTSSSGVDYDSHRRDTMSPSIDSDIRGSSPRMAASPPASLTERVRTLVGGSAEDKSTEHLGTLPVTIVWPYSASIVYVAGSFNGWQQQIQLTKAPTDQYFSVTVDVYPGLHQYKFFVDGEWRYDPGMPTTADVKGVVNNVMEVIPPEKPKRKVSFSGSSQGRERDADAEEEFAESDDEYATNANTAYGHVLPSIEGLQGDVPAIPPHFADILLNNDIRSADPYLLPVPQHVTVNHLYLRSRRRQSTEVLILGITQRFKTKFVTTVYYKPIK